MQLKDYLNMAREYSKIVVSGPQRAGTTISTVIIGHELGLSAILEEHSSYNRDPYIFTNILNTKDNFVIQAPGMCYFLDNIKNKDVLITVMRRRVEDIILSQERINWTRRYEPVEKKKYNQKLDKILTECTLFNKKDLLVLPISVLKYLVLPLQKRMCQFDIKWIELEYDSLEEHELFIPKERRKMFKPRQYAE